MNEKIIITAKMSTLQVEKKGKEKKRTSFIGVLIPLAAPLIIFIDMQMEDIKFSRLDGVQKFFFFAGIFFCVVLAILHNMGVKLENSKLMEAEYVSERQSLIVTNQRVYGSLDNSPFSYSYEEISKAYSTWTAGNQAKLVIKLISNDTIEFQHIENMQTVISCINDMKAKCKINSAPCVNHEEDDPIIPSMKSAEQSSNLTSGQRMSKMGLYNVVISSATGSLKQIKAIREVTSLDLASARSIISSLPYTVAESQDELTAQKIKAKLELAGISVDLTPI